MGSLKLFPLNLVAYPTKVVPLHIFEERYKTLINDCISSDQEFGMVYSMDIITKGQRIFKIHSNKIENDLNIGEVEFQKDKIEAIDDQFDKLKEKYLKLLLHLGLVSQIERHMNKKQSIELIEHIQLPNEIELLLISTRSEIDRLKILDEIFDQIFNKGIDKVNGEVFQS